MEDIYINSNSINKDKDNIRVLVSSNYLDKWITLNSVQNYKEYSPEKLIKIIYESQASLIWEGSEFSSATKLILNINKADALIVNSVESELYLISNNYLMCYLYRWNFDGM